MTMFGTASPGCQSLRPYSNCACDLLTKCLSEPKRASKCRRLGMHTPRRFGPTYSMCKSQTSGGHVDHINSSNGLAVCGVDPDFPDCHSVETISCEYDPTTKRLKQTRVFEVVNPAPYILRLVRSLLLCCKIRLAHVHAAIAIVFCFLGRVYQADQPRAS